MTERRPLRFAMRLLISLAVPTVLTMASVRLLLSYEFLRFEYQRPGFPADSYGLTAADRSEYGMFAITYLFDDRPLDFLADIRLPGQKCWNAPVNAGDCPLFNDIELRHLRDVKRLIGPAFALSLLLSTLSGLGLLLSYRNPALRREIATGLSQGSRLTVVTIVLLGVLTLASWNSAFDAFHELFFAPGTWRFPFSDSLIRLYPEQLFVDAAAIVAAVTMLGALVIMLFASLWKRRSG